MIVGQLFKVLEGECELRMEGLPNIHRFVQTYLKSEGDTNTKVPYDMDQIRKIIEYTNDFYMDFDTLLIENPKKIDPNLISNLEVTAIYPTVANYIIVHIKYESL